MLGRYGNLTWGHGWVGIVSWMPLGIVDVKSEDDCYNVDVFVFPAFINLNNNCYNVRFFHRKTYESEWTRS